MVKQVPTRRPGAPETPRVRSAAGAHFWVIVLLGLAATVCYSGALVRFPLLAIYARPIQNMTKLTGADGWVGLTLTIGVLSLFLGYGAGALALADAQRAARGRAWSWWLVGAIIVFPLLFLALLALVYPTTSVDLYDYIFRGRMLVRYRANTFIQTPSDFKSDPLFWYTAWRRAVTAYGPLWEGLSWLTARLAGERALLLRPSSEVGVSGAEALQDAELLRLMLAYKGLAAVGFLFCGAAIWLTLRRIAPAYRWLGLYLWLWNPLALWESLAAGHNDAWMAGLVVLAVGLLMPRHVDKETGRQGDTESSIRTYSASPLLLFSLSVPIAAFLILTVGGLIKYLALMFGPLLLSAALRRTSGWRARLRLIIAGGAACAALVVLAYAPFWVGWATLRNFGDRGALFTNSWLAVLQAPITLDGLRQLVPAKSLLALFVAEVDVRPLAVSMGLGLLFFGVLWATWRSWRAPGELARHVLWLLLWFLFLCNPWFQPWYLLWALALLAIQPWRTGAARIVGLFCCTAMLSYLGGVFLLPILGWDVDGAEWNALTSALIYLPPLLTLLWGRRLTLWAGWRWVRRYAERVPADPAVNG